MSSCPPTLPVLTPISNPTPQLDATWFAGICQLGPRPLVVTGWLKIWLQNHFAVQAYIEDQSGAVYKSLWQPDFSKSRISIESVTIFKPETVEQRPAIIIKRNSWKHIRIGIDNRLMWELKKDGSTQYCNLWQGSHTLFCATGDGAETEKLAAEVFRELNEFGPSIRRILDLIRFEVMEVGELHKIKTNARENFAVPITVAYAYREDWIVKQTAPINKLDLATFQP
jgi:hypothetical protein